jgi:hypothetical protein
MSIAPKCTCNNPNDTEYFQAGYSYCPIHDNKQTTPDTQLPAEWLDKIDNEAKLFTNVEIGDWAKLTPDKVNEWEQTKAVWEHGAKEYATIAYQAQQEIESLTNQLKKQNDVQDENIKQLRKENEKVQQRINEYAEEIESAGTLIKEIEELKRWKEEAKKLLEKVIYRHEGGLLPDRLLYLEIKTFLDGK